MPKIIRVRGGIFVKAYTDEERLHYLSNFQDLRSKGLSGTGAAARVGVSYKALRRWEKGPTGRRLEKRRGDEVVRDVTSSLRADNQQFLPLDEQAPVYRFPETLHLTTTSGIVVHGTPEELAEFVKLMEKSA